jgi:sialate O-acetylesterase
MSTVDALGSRDECDRKGWAQRWGACLLLATALFGELGSASAAQMPQEDVIDVPAIEDGLCVSNLFQANMVLQRDKAIRVWGWAEPGESVTVTFGDSRATVTAEATREWRAELAPMPANSTPQSMTIEGSTATLTLENILMGDVWVLGGQSNMEFELAKVENGELEIASANYPLIRILTVPFAEGPEIARGFPRLHEWSAWFSRHFRKGDWDVCTPEIARELSAIGYVFARRVHMASGVPIGVIDASRGGTSVETWVPAERLAELQDSATQASLAEWNAKVEAWDPVADLKKRRADRKRRLAKLAEEGKPIPRRDVVEPTEPLPGPIADMNYPGNSYAGILSPLVGLPIKGAIFHQGYNNTLNGMLGVRLYEAVFPVMIESWRSAFDDPKMPFGIVSLCTDGYPQTRENYLEKMVNVGMHIRAAQYQTFVDLKDSGDENIGFASTYDLRRRWYHPQVKLPAGERIARWALATQYGFGSKLPWTPPRLLAQEAKDGALHLHLDAKVSDPEDDAIQGFAIAGSDRRFQPADVAYAEDGLNDQGQPRPDRTRLILTSPLVAEPIHFRYAWGRNPIGNLQVSGNKDLPFATQRSDDWDLGTVPVGVLEGEVGLQLTRAQQNRLRKAFHSEDVRRQIAEAQAFLKAQSETEEEDR